MIWGYPHFRKPPYTHICCVPGIFYNLHKPSMYTLHLACFVLCFMSTVRRPHGVPQVLRKTWGTPWRLSSTPCLCNSPQEVHVSHVALCVFPASLIWVVETWPIQNCKADCLISWFGILWQKVTHTVKTNDTMRILKLVSQIQSGSDALITYNMWIYGDEPSNELSILGRFSGSIVAALGSPRMHCMPQGMNDGGPGLGLPDALQSILQMARRFQDLGAKVDLEATWQNDDMNLSDFLKYDFLKGLRYSIPILDFL